MLLRFLGRRLLHAAVLVYVAASASLVLVHLAGSGAFDGFGVHPDIARQERARLGFDRPLGEQYLTWMSKAVRLDFGESIRYNRPVGTLIAERFGNTLVLGGAAILIALVLGLPAGVYTAASPGAAGARWIRAASLVLVSAPPLVLALVLLLAAARTGIVPAGGYDPGSGGLLSWLAAITRYLPLPALAIALPIAATLERVQSQSLGAALADRSILAARARGVSEARATWVHAWRLSLPPVLGLLGIILGSVLSGSLVVEIVMAWPGVGDLMHQALVARDLHLATACAAAGALCLEAGLSSAELARLAADPRARELA